MSGSGDLGVLTFTGKSPGSSTLEIIPSELYFYDSEGNEVIVPDLEIEAATIIVQPFTQLIGMAGIMTAELPAEFIFINPEPKWVFGLMNFPR